MKKTSKIERTVPAFYRRTPVNLICFGYIHGLRSLVNHVSIKDAARYCAKAYDWDEDLFNAGSQATTYNRMQKELKEIKPEQNPPQGFALTYRIISLHLLLSGYIMAAKTNVPSATDRAVRLFYETFIGDNESVNFINSSYLKHYSL